MVFCNNGMDDVVIADALVTILILIDGFLQSLGSDIKMFYKESHNPYFNRWFSAMQNTRISYIMRTYCHNPYFNRWFSAITYERMVEE